MKTNSSSVLNPELLSDRSSLRAKISAALSCLVVVAVAVGCASTKVSDRDQVVTGTIARPGNIWVYAFAATASDVPAESALANHPDLDATPLTPAEIAQGKTLGSLIATQLVSEIQHMGMPAQVATASSKPQINDLVIRGYLVSIHDGSAAKRVAIGFGSGASELKTVAEGFQVTPTGLRKLGSGAVNAGGSKTPGSAVGLVALIATANPVGLIVGTGAKVYGEASGSSKVEGRAKATAKEISDVLKKRFQEQGWISQ